MTAVLTIPSMIRYEDSHLTVKAGDLLKWRGHQVKRIKLIDRSGAEALHAGSRAKFPVTITAHEVTFSDNEFGMFVRWSAPSSGDGSRVPIVYVPRFALYNTWFGWYADSVYPSWE